MFKFSDLPRRGGGTAAAGSLAGGMSVDDLKERLIEALRGVYDPEIPVNIYDLGLIYVLDVEDNGAVHVEMTLTAPACPVAGTLPGLVAATLRKVEGVSDVDVELVWDPPWSAERMSDEARLTLGMYD